MLALVSNMIFIRFRNLIVRLLVCLIPKSSLRKKIRTKFIKEFKIDYKKIMLFHKQQLRYKLIIKKLKEKVKKGEKCKVGFYCMYDSVFPTRTVFEAMKKDSFFSPSIVVIPDILRGEENKFFQLKKTYSGLLKKYGNRYVCCAYDYKNKEFLDYSSKFDIVFFTNPYDVLTDDLYTIKKYVMNGGVAVFVSYGFMPDFYAREHLINLESLNLCWKVFVDTPENLKEFVNYTDIKGKNAILSGYCKMDSLNFVPKKNLPRKKIIIAPHHTVNMPCLPLSNFMEYSDFFLDLPQMYPQIDFVFRPHPLLFITLSQKELWGKEKVKKYIDKITSYSNVEFQNGGDYFDTFVNSSAIIHDCSSFLMEYLYTGHPACFLLRSNESIKEIFTPIGEKCLEKYYKAFNKEDIISFIDNVVLLGNDPLKQDRISFTKQELMINYPNSTGVIIETIKDKLS